MNVDASECEILSLIQRWIHHELASPYTLLVPPLTQRVPGELEQAHLVLIEHDQDSVFELQEIILILIKIRQFS